MDYLNLVHKFLNSDDCIFAPDVVKYLKMSLCGQPQRGRCAIVTAELKHLDLIDKSFDPLTLTTGRFRPGDADLFVAGQTDDVKRRIGEAELLYYRGNVQEAMRRFEEIADVGSLPAVTASILCRSICLLADGSVDTLMDVFRSAAALKGVLPEDDPMRVLSGYLLLYFNILIYNAPAIRFPEVGVRAFSVPASLKPMAFYVYTHYLLEIGDVGRAVGMAEGALLTSDESVPLPEINLSLVICAGYMLRSEWSKAEYYFRHAWKLAKPDGLIMPFVEHRRMLFGMVEKCLRYSEPQVYKQIQDLANDYHRHWVYIHNALTGDEITTSLTAIEYNVAKLAKLGMVNQEIADFTGISVNSVRAHLRHIFNKLGIESRKEISHYVI